MVVIRSLGALSLFFASAASKQIWDIWQTTWDRSKLFTSLAPTSPINFVSPGTTGSADIVVNDGAVYQQMVRTHFDGIAIVLTLQRFVLGWFWSYSEYVIASWVPTICSTSFIADSAALVLSQLKVSFTNTCLRQFL